MVDKDEAVAVFGRQFGGRPQWAVFSPGRVNLIGEHIDYNDGLVLPMAIDRGITLAARRRPDRRVNLWSAALEQADSFDLADVEQPGRQHWSSYLRGPAALLMRQGVDLPGADLAVLSDLPVGGGLSSSASLEVAAALAFLQLAGATMEPLALAKLCQQAEHEYAGVPCGLMDQFAVVFGRRGHAIRMDCRSLEHELVPAEHEAIAWLVLDSRAPRSLAASGYAKRRKECDRALAVLRKANPDLASLRDVTLEMLEANEDRLGATLARRVHHVVTEVQRVLEGAEYLSMGRFDLFGRLMYGSHYSLANDYQVSSKELDFIVTMAEDTLGVYGCRMTGGGWGGCAIAVLAAEAVRFFIERVGQSYRSKFRLQAVPLVARPCDGARAEEF